MNSTGSAGFRNAGPCIGMTQRCVSGAVSRWPGTTIRTTGVEEDQMTLNTKTLIKGAMAVLEGKLELSVDKTQVSATVLTLLAILAVNPPSDVLRLLEDTAKNMRDMEAKKQ